MARFYSNENFPSPVVRRLRQLGHDVVTSLETGDANWAVPDAEVLGFATAECRILLPGSFASRGGLGARNQSARSFVG